MGTGEPRLRLKEKVDFSKAKSNCKRCHGTGVHGYRTMDLPSGEKNVKVPIVCRCVSRAGGIQQDSFDKILGEIQNDLDTGKFAENLVNDIGRLEKSDQERAIEQLRVQSLRTDIDQQVKTALVEAVQRIEAKASQGGER